MNKIVVIAAVSKNGVIGKDDDLIFKDKQDLSNFKKVTTGNVVIMGRKTWDSLPIQPLPNRVNVILSQSRVIAGTNYFTIFDTDQIEVLRSELKPRDIYIIGGGEIYKQAMNVADEILLSVFNEEVEGDTVFPEIDSRLFKETEVTQFDNFRLIKYIRI